MDGESAAGVVWLVGILMYLWYDTYILQYIQHIYGISTVHVYSTSTVSLQHLYSVCTVYLYSISLDMTHLRVLLVLTDHGNNNNNNAYVYAGRYNCFLWLAVEL
jgi:hypothetical protein